MIVFREPPNQPSVRCQYAPVSDAAFALQKLTLTQRAHTRQRAVFADLDALWNDAATENWAGRDGAKLMPGAFWRAQEFLQAIVFTAPAPELTVDNYGAVELDWMRAKHHRLSLSIEGSGRVTYAFRFGERSGEGTEWFRTEVPAQLIGLIVEAAQGPAA